MAKFFRGKCQSAIRFKGEALLWDFSEGMVETDDKDIIDTLVAEGAELVKEQAAPVAQAVTPQVDPSPTFKTKAEITAYAMDVHGLVIEANSNKTMDEMLVELQGAIADKDAE